MKPSVWWTYLFVCARSYKIPWGVSAAVVVQMKPWCVSPRSPTLSTLRKSKLCRCAEDDAMSEVLTVDAILFGLLVFSGILGNILVIHVVRLYRPSYLHLSVLAGLFSVSLAFPFRCFSQPVRVRLGDSLPLTLFWCTCRWPTCSPHCSAQCPSLCPTWVWMCLCLRAGAESSCCCGCGGELWAAGWL